MHRTQPGRLHLERLGDALPADFSALQLAAAAEGHRMLDRLAQEWVSGANRFSGDGEALIAAWWDSALVGIGGLTRDPQIDGALRMRRFYVAPPFRGRGVGRTLAAALLALAGPDARVTAHPGTAAATAFWRGVGFASGPLPNILARQAEGG
jgi:GNAT superfamily N-acetyltransferase